MTDDKIPRYCATDVARHELDLDAVAKLWPYSTSKDLNVASMIAQTCLIGYGGHYDEPLPDEEVDLGKLQDLVAKEFRIAPEEAYALVSECRQHYAELLRRHGEEGALERWRREDWLTARAHDPDHCPACGRRIGDNDDAGCEAPDGQRWCVAHALEALASLFPRGAG